MYIGILQSWSLVILMMILMVAEELGVSNEGHTVRNTLKPKAAYSR